MKKVRTLVLAGVLSAALFTGVTYSYFTDADTVDNIFTVGRVTIDLQEPEFEPGMPGSENLVPGGIVSKDPLVVNTGTNDVYVFLKVTIPTKKLKTAAANGMINFSGEAVETQLFGYEKSEYWTVLEDPGETGDLEPLFNRSEDHGFHEYDDSAGSGSVSYLYAYTQGEAATMKKLKNGEQTEPLFDHVRMAEVIENDEMKSVVQQITVTAYAIQADFLNNGSQPIDGVNPEGMSRPEEVWGILKGQTAA